MTDSPRGPDPDTLGNDPLDESQPIPLRIRKNKRARRLILRADPATGGAVVTCPTWVGEAEARAFAAKQEDWVRAQLAEGPRPLPFADGAEIPFLGRPHVIRHRPEARGGVWVDGDEIHVSGQAEHLRRRLTDWLKREARRRIVAVVTRAAGELDVSFGRITLRDTTSRWGSCAVNGNLSFSWRLVLAPEWVIDYVACHEVAHLLEHNHGPRFWALVDRLVPDVERCRVWLHGEGAALQYIGHGD